MKRVYLHCTITMSIVHWTSWSPTWSLKVVFLFHSFLVITVVQRLYIKNLFHLRMEKVKPFSLCFVRIIDNRHGRGNNFWMSGLRMENIQMYLTECKICELNFPKKTKQISNSEQQSISNFSLFHNIYTGSLLRANKLLPTLPRV